MSVRLYGTIRLTGRVEDAEAAEALAAALVEDRATVRLGNAPFDTVQEAAAYLLQVRGGQVSFENDELPVGEYRAVESACIGHGVSFVRRHDDGGAFPAERATYDSVNGLTLTALASDQPVVTLDELEAALARGIDAVRALVDDMRRGMDVADAADGCLYLADDAVQALERLVGGAPRP